MQTNRAIVIAVIPAHIFSFLEAAWLKSALGLFPSPRSSAQRFHAVPKTIGIAITHGHLSLKSMTGTAEIVAMMKDRFQRPNLLTSGSSQPALAHSACPREFWFFIAFWSRAAHPQR